MKKLLTTASVFVLGAIEENIQNGIDYEGKKYSYSEKTFFRPYYPNLYLKLKKQPDLFDITKSKSGKLGFLIHGYKKFKEYIHPDSKDDFLTVSGKMLSNMKIKYDSDKEATIGWTDKEQAQKAYWFNVSGVGRSRKLWKFLGITKKQEDDLYKKIEDEFYKVAIDELFKIKIKKAT